MITSTETPKKPSQCWTDWIWTRTSPPRRKPPRSKDGDVDGDDVGDSEDDDDDHEDVDGDDDDGNNDDVYVNANGDYDDDAHYCSGSGSRMNITTGV